MDKILITGATGFVGSELAKKLCQEYQVYALVRTSSNTRALDPLREKIDKLEIRYGNLTDYASIRKIVRDIAPQYIIHVGAATAVRHSFENPMEYQEVNHLATVNLVHSALEVPNFKKFLFASTMEVYGWQPPGEPFVESVPRHPESPYAVAKMAAEEYIVMAGEAYGLPYIISRACNTFGRKTNTGFVVEYLATTMLKGETVYLGTPDAVRDLMYVDDHVNAYITALKSNVKNEIFNFGTGNRIKMKDIAEKMRTMTDFKGTITHSFPPGYPARPAVSPFLSLNSEKAKRMLNWQPQVSLEDGLRKTVEFWKGKK